jgi:hypothetical protein
MAKMSNSDFVESLAGLRDTFRWELEPAFREEGRERRAVVRFRIRGRASGADGTPLRLDPLRAVCYARTGRLFGRQAWSDVADTLDMELSVAAVLLAASNDRIWAGPAAHRVPADHLRALRRRLLDAVGLEEASSVQESRAIASS